MLEFATDDVRDQFEMSTADAERRDHLLDAALEESYPASDPVGSLYFN